MQKFRAIIIIFIGIAVLAVVGFVFQDFLEKSEPTHGSASDNISGWGWSDTIGWISFNNTDCDADDNGIGDGTPPGCPSGAMGSYGVNVDLGSGNFSGYAWSDNIGWIIFNPNPDFVTYPGAGYPAGPYYSARYDSVTSEVNGWARILLCQTNPADCNGWDGWIKLGDPANTWTDQVSINTDTNEFEGWAWGSELIGWISFNCKGPDMCGD